MLYSAALLTELVDVLNRPHLCEKYQLTPQYWHLFLLVIRLQGKVIEPVRQIKVCRDPKDGMFLEVAVGGGADYVVSEDSDLLALTPFENIAIVTPPWFMACLEKDV